MDEFVEPLPTGEISDAHVENTRIRLCLTADRDDDVRAAIAANPVTERRLATIWWDV
jgi:hypothetical protein